MGFYLLAKRHTVVMNNHTKGDMGSMMHEFTGESPRRATVQVPFPDRYLTTEITGDYSLPDYQPEIKRLLRISTNVLPPNRFAGSSGTELSGTLDYYVLYMGHDGGVYCAPLSAEYRMEAEPDSAPRAGVPSPGEPMVCLCDTVAEPPVGRVTAPRRLNIRCKLRAKVKLYGECPLMDIDREEANVEALEGKVEVGRLYQAVGELLPLQDDVILSPAQEEWRVVCAEGKVMVSEAAPAMGLVNCRGEVTVKLTLCPAESEEEFASDTAEGRTSPQITVMQRKIPFAQAVEVEGVTPACVATACGYCTDLAVIMEDGHVHVDLGVVCEVRAHRNEVVHYVKDLYSTRRADVCRHTEYPTEAASRAFNGNFTLSDSLELSAVGIDPATRIADVTVTALPQELMTDPGKGRCVLTGTTRWHLLLLRDGEYASADMELPFRYEFEDPAAISCTAESTPLHYDGTVTVVTCRARMDGERVGGDAELAVSLRTHSIAPMTALSEAGFGEEVTRRRGEYVICFPAPTDTLWSVAKRYHAPIAGLTAANNLPSVDKADAAESLEGVQYLIV